MVAGAIAKLGRLGLSPLIDLHRHLIEPAEPAPRAGVFCLRGVPFLRHFGVTDAVVHPKDNIARVPRMRARVTSHSDAASDMSGTR